MPQSKLRFFKTGWFVARKEYSCCECEKAILPGEKYRRFFGAWGNDGCGREHTVYQTCEKCEGAWVEILEIFYKNGADGLCRVFTLLKEAIEVAFRNEFVEKDHPLVIGWLGPKLAGAK